MARRLGVVDIGTNTIKVKITDYTSSDHFEQVLYKDFPSCLGQNLDLQNTILPVTLASCFEALKEVHEILLANHVHDYTCVATHALRVAKDQEIIIDLIRSYTGFEVKVITGEEESMYSLWGVKMDLPDQMSFACINAGGGSTELSFHSAEGDRYFHFEFGALNLYSDFIKGKSNIDGGIEDIIAHITHEFRNIVSDKNPVIERVFSMGGSIYSAGYIYKGDMQRNFDQLAGLIISKDHLNLIIKKLKTATEEEKRKTPGMDLKRMDSILTGTLIHYTLLQLLKKDELTISTRSISDGIIYGMATGNV